jgi:predicted transcriptional regulator
MSSKEVTNVTEKETDNTPLSRKSATKAAEPRQTVIYCGPTIKGVINQNAVFSNGLPKAIKDLSSAFKPFGRLIVPVDKLTITKSAIQQKGSVENISYCEVLNYQKGE